MATFDEQGIKALSGLVEGDAQELIGRLKAIKAMSEEYTSFAGAKSDMPGSVRFVIRTDSIEK